MHELLWLIVVVVAIAILLAIAVVGVIRRQRKPFPTQMFPANYVDPYERRIPEIEAMFVNQPREAVAAAKLLVDDMLTRMGYPVRISNDERARDLRRYDRTLADRYRSAASLKSAPSTEDLRRSLQNYLAIARDTVDKARAHHKRHEQPAVREDETRPQIAG
ncbi:MAG TPA: hypothetical protein VF134_03385 [Candidatus Dormibacteraeota bacterium]